MSVLGRMYRGETRFDFVAISRRTLVVSGILVAISIAMLFLRPLNLSIDFTGGTIITAANTRGVGIEEVRNALARVGEEGATIQLTSEGTILVRTEALTGEQQDALVSAVADVSGTAVDAVNEEAVGPTFGVEVTRRAIRALVIFLVVVAIFISFRFDWKMAAGALVALFHDLAMTAGIYALVGFVVTPATVIAVLTILGYSLYDTVVVFDKVTENVVEFRQRLTYDEIVNRSMNQVLMRSLNTSLTSLLPVGSILFVGAFALGAATLREFALALFIGIAVGTYSSIFIAAPLLAMMRRGEEEWQRAARRAARRKGEPAPAVAAAAAGGGHGASSPKPAPVRHAGGGKPSGGKRSGGKKGANRAKPRPPRKRKKKRR